MISGRMEIDRGTLMSGSAVVSAQRGTDVWGANYVFNASGVQNDILVIADAFNKLSTSGAFATDVELAAVSGTITRLGTITSGTFNAGWMNTVALSGCTLNETTFISDFKPISNGIYAIGASGYPLRASGIYMKNNAGVTMQLIITAGGVVSGIAAV